MKAPKPESVSDVEVDNVINIAKDAKALRPLGRAGESWRNTFVQILSSLQADIRQGQVKGNTARVERSSRMILDAARDTLQDFRRSYDSDSHQRLKEVNRTDLNGISKILNQDLADRTQEDRAKSVEARLALAADKIRLPGAFSASAQMHAATQVLVAGLQKYRQDYRGENMISTIEKVKAQEMNLRKIQLKIEYGQTQQTDYRRVIAIGKDFMNNYSGSLSSERKAFKAAMMEVGNASHDAKLARIEKEISRWYKVYTAIDDRGVIDNQRAEQAKSSQAVKRLLRTIVQTEGTSTPREKNINEMLNKVANSLGTKMRIDSSRKGRVEAGLMRHVYRYTDSKRNGLARMIRYDGLKAVEKLRVLNELDKNAKVSYRDLMADRRNMNRLKMTDSTPQKRLRR